MPENSLLKKMSRIAVVSAVAMALSGCAELPPPAQTETVDYRGCLLTQSDASTVPLSQVSEYSLDQAVVTYGIQGITATSTPAKFVNSVQKLKKSKCNLIVITGPDFGKQLVKVVESNADVNFIYVSNKTESEVTATNLDNLVVYSVDLYEVGIISGYLAADQSALHHVTLGCGSRIGQTFLSGVRFGAQQYDLKAGTVTQVDARQATAVFNDTIMPDVVLLAGCSGGFVPWDQPAKFIGYGKDSYLLPENASIKSQIASTVTLQIGSRILEVVSSDLEKDFIGGSLASVTASFGNGMLSLSPEHEIAISENTLTRLRTVLADYEAGLK